MGKGRTPQPGATPPPTPARLAASLGARLPAAGRRVGLLGGSFNPAHGGHRHVSLEAMKRLGLDEVWWLVSPQNPLKPRADMAPIDERLASARAVAAGHPGLRPATVEAVLGTLYTAETLAALWARLPRVRFVWLMGADNLLQVHRWHAWPAIFRRVPVAVCARPSYSLSGGAAKAARRFARARRPQHAARVLPGRRPPAWVFLQMPQDARSASAIRARTAWVRETAGRAARDRGASKGG